MNPTPIFVLGLQRSGTTWLANCLGGHPLIAAVESAEHRGIHESIFFSHFARAFGDLRQDDNFRRFVGAFTTCDYFLLSGMNRDRFLADCPRDYAGAFRLVMDHVAERAGADYWLEKSPDHTMLGPELATLFPDARFVGILREPDALMRSRLWAYGRRPPGPVLRIPRVLAGGVSISLHARALADFCRRSDRALLLTYEELLDDTRGTLERVTDFLGCDFDDTMLAVRYAPNTSFKNPARPTGTLTRPDKVVLGIARVLAGLIPWRLLAWFRNWKHRFKGVTWPRWCWQMRDRNSA